MIVYGTALLAICYLIGDFLGKLLGKALNVDANVGGVAIAMMLLIASKELLAKKGLMPQLTQFGIIYWAGMYIPIVVAMAAGQNVVAALSGGVMGIAVSVVTLVATVLGIRWFNKLANDYDDFEWQDSSSASGN